MKMIAPKISGEFMTEVYEGDWEYITNGLDINVYIDDYEVPSYYCAIKFNGIYINEPLKNRYNTPQEAADQAVKFLHGLRNIINYIK